MLPATRSIFLFKMCDSEASRRFAFATEKCFLQPGAYFYLKCATQKRAVGLPSLLTNVTYKHRQMLLTTSYKCSHSIPTNVPIPSQQMFPFYPNKCYLQASTNVHNNHRTNVPSATGQMLPTRKLPAPKGAGVWRIVSMFLGRVCPRCSAVVIDCYPCHCLLTHSHNSSRALRHWRSCRGFK